MSSGKGPTLIKTTLLPGQNGVTVVASLPTNQSRDVTANIPIEKVEVPKGALQDLGQEVKGQGHF